MEPCGIPGSNCALRLYAHTSREIRCMRWLAGRTSIYCVVDNVEAGDAGRLRGRTDVLELVLRLDPHVLDFADVLLDMRDLGPSGRP